MGGLFRVQLDAKKSKWVFFFGNTLYDDTLVKIARERNSASAGSHSTPDLGPQSIGFGCLLRLADRPVLKLKTKNQGAHQSEERRVAPHFEKRVRKASGKLS